MADLRVKFGGVEFRNPVWVASMGPETPWTSWKECPDIQLKMIKKYNDQGLGAYITGSIWFEDAKYEWRGKAKHVPIKTRGFAEREALFSMAIMPDDVFPRTNGLEIVRRIKKEFPEMGLIASIAGPGVDPKGWGDLAADAKQAGADLVELNVCTFMIFKDVAQALEAMGTREKYPPGAGIMAGLMPEVTAKIVEGIRNKTDIPIIVKITPSLDMMRLIPGIEMYKAAGATGVTCSHASMGVPGPDIYNRGQPPAPYMDKITFMAVTGPAHRLTSCYRNVAAAAKYVPSLDVSACGGLVIPEHAVEAIMLGAKSVQLCSGLLLNGIGFISQTIEFINKYMDEQGYKRVDDFMGLGLPYIAEFGELLEWWHAHPVVSKIDYLKCNKCGICQDNWCYATYWEDGRPKVNTKLCHGCGVCVYRCPVGAFSLVPVKVAGKMPEFLEKQFGR